MRWPTAPSDLATISAHARRIAAADRDRWFEAVRKWLGRDGQPHSPRRPTQAELDAALAHADAELTMAARPIPLRFTDPPRSRRWASPAP